MSRSRSRRNRILAVAASAVAALLMLASCGTSSGNKVMPVFSYTVVYDGNGCDGGTVPVDAASYGAGDIVSVPGNPGALVKSGYSFTGWNTRADGLGTTYTQSQTFTMGTANVTLYARWTANPTYTVTYDGNGNDSGAVPVDTTHYEQGQTVTLLGNTGNLAKSGFVFAGWNSQADGLGTTYGASFTMGSADVIVYALWTASPVLATVSTTTVSAITGTTAASGGNVSNDGGAAVTARGICWNTGGTPTIADAHTSDGTGTGGFASGLTGLAENTTYVVRAYAVNSVGTAYGNALSFKTASGAGASGSLDSNFNTTGIVITDMGMGDNKANAVAIQSDGKIVMAGYTLNGGTKYSIPDKNFALVRYNTDGSLDTTFNTTGMVSTPVGTAFSFAQAVAIQPDGKIVAAGYTFNGTDNDFAVVRYNTDGSLDTTFNTSGKVITPILASNDEAYAVAIQSDGKIIAAGAAFTGNAGSNVNNDDFALVRYNTDGSLDTTFNTTGKVTTYLSVSNDQVNALAIQSNGKIVAAGFTGDLNGNVDFALARYNADGSLDNTFNLSGKVRTPVATNSAIGSDTANAVAIQSDGKIVAAGYADGGSSRFDFALVRYNTDGSLDTSFNTTGMVLTDIASGYDSANGVAIQSDGKIVTAGYSSSLSEFAVVRYTANGSLDSTFHATGVVTTYVANGSEAANAVAIQADGKIVAAGYALGAADEDFALVRYWP